MPPTGRRPRRSAVWRTSRSATRASPTWSRSSQDRRRRRIARPHERAALRSIALARRLPLSASTSQAGVRCSSDVGTVQRELQKDVASKLGSTPFDGVRSGSERSLQPFAGTFVTAPTRHLSNARRTGAQTRRMPVRVRILRPPSTAPCGWRSGPCSALRSRPARGRVGVEDAEETSKSRMVDGGLGAEAGVDDGASRFARSRVVEADRAGADVADAVQRVPVQRPDAVVLVAEDRDEVLVGQVDLVRADRRRCWRRSPSALRGRRGWNSSYCGIV